MFYNFSAHFPNLMKMGWFCFTLVFAITLTNCVGTNKIVIGNYFHITQLCLTDREDGGYNE